MVAPTAWAALLKPQPVIRAPGRQILPAASPRGAYIAYSRNWRGHPNRFNAFVKPKGGSRVKVNVRGQGYVGGIDGTTLVYQAVHPGAKVGSFSLSYSNVKTFDLVTHTRTTVLRDPGALWYYWPTISHGTVLAGQVEINGDGQLNEFLTLDDLSGHGIKTLDSKSGCCSLVRRRWTQTPFSHSDLYPGQINGDFVVWDRQSRSVVRYSISSDTKTVLPQPTGTHQYAASVSSDGTVFYARSQRTLLASHQCGESVVIRRHTVGGSDTKLARLPAGYDTNRTYAVDQGTGGTTVFFDRVNCTTGASDIYKLRIGP